MSANRLKTVVPASAQDGEMFALLDFLRQQTPEERIRILRGDAASLGGTPPAAPIDIDPLRHAACSALISLPRPALGSLLLTLSIWMGLEPRRKALLLKTLAPQLKDGTVAAACDVNRCTLYQWPEYRRLKSYQAQPSSVTRGEQDEDGNIEAWLDAAG